MSDFKIIGPSDPEVGKEIIYKTSNSNLLLSLPGQVNPDENNPFVEQVKWSIYILEYGKWNLKEKNNKTGATATYTFAEKSLKREGIRIVAVLGDKKATLDIKPLKSIERKIVKVELCDALGKLQTKPFAYNQTVLARVYCLNLNNCTVHVTLWEDDAPGAGHNSINKKNKAITKSGFISNGIAEVKFKLAPDFAKMADAQLAKGEKGEDKTHEYYVTAEVFRQKTKSSNNINVTNPNDKTADTKTIHQEPVAPKPAGPAQQKGSSKKEEKGIAETVGGTLYDWVETGFKAIPTILPDPMEVFNSFVKVFVPDSKNEKGICVCKENNFYWSNKLTCEERKKVLQVCANIWGEDKKKEKASELMAIIHLETDTSFSPSKKGVSTSGAKYIGLIQFSATTAQSIGTTYGALEKMTFIEQMDYVEKYLKQNKDKMKTIVDFYLQVIKPSDVGKGDQPDYAVFDESISVPDGDGSQTSQEQRNKNITKEPWVTKYGYASNPSFMTGDERTQRRKWVYTRQRFEDRYGYINGKTTIKEIDDSLKKDHYKPGAIELFKGECDDIIQENKSGERAPWMKIALQEAKDYGGKTENLIDARIRIYHNEGGGLNAGYRTAWCASFTNWCIVRSGFVIKKSASSQSYLSSNKVEKCDVFFGAIAVFTDCDSEGNYLSAGTGHNTFVFGKLPNGKYCVLGGNQGNKLRVSDYDCSGAVFHSYGNVFKKFRGFYKPTGYIIKNIDKLKNTDEYETVGKANEVTISIKLEASQNGERSQ